MTRPYVATMLVLLWCAGCGGSAEEGSDPAGAGARETAAVATSAAEPRAPEAAYRAWLRAVADHDAAAACDRHAPDFTIGLRQRAILDDRAELGDPCEDFVAILWDDPATETDPVDVEVTQQTEEDALLAVVFPDRDQTVRMVRRYGEWFLASTTARQAGPVRWLDAWCALEIGMTRSQLVESMGEPSGEYTVANGGEPQLWWASGPYDFRAYLHPDGSVAELVADHDALVADDREQLDCPELRNRTNS